MLGGGVVCMAGIVVCKVGMRVVAAGGGAGSPGVGWKCVLCFACGAVGVLSCYSYIVVLLLTGWFADAEMRGIAVIILNITLAKMAWLRYNTAGALCGAGYVGTRLPCPSAVQRTAEAEGGDCRHRAPEAQRRTGVQKKEKRK